MNIDTPQELDATLIIRKVKEREQLLKIARGNNAWRFLNAVFGLVMLSLVSTNYHGKDGAMLPWIFATGVVLSIVTAIQSNSRRIDALIKLLDEDLSKRGNS